jgi:hypothetical protein
MTASNTPLRSLRHRQQLLYVMVFSLATVVVWVGVGLLRSQRSTQLSAQQRELAAPLTPTLNRTVLTTLSNKRQPSDSELLNFPLYLVDIGRDGKAETKQRGAGESTLLGGQSSPLPTAVPEATPEAEASPSAEVTPSAEVPASSSASATGSQ